MKLRATHFQMIFKLSYYTFEWLTFVLILQKGHLHESLLHALLNLFPTQNVRPKSDDLQSAKNHEKKLHEHCYSILIS